MKRTAILKVRVSASEKSEIEKKAQIAGLTLSDFIRKAVAGSRVRQTQAERERLRLLAQVGNNLNQLARWANIHKHRAEALDVLTALVSLENTVRADTPPPPAPEEAPCT